MKKSVKLLTLCAALAAPAIFSPSHAAGVPTVEERLQALEAGYAQLKEENARLRALLAAQPAPAPAPAAAPQVAAAPAPAPAKARAADVVFAGNEQQLTISGFIHGQYEAGDAGDERFAGINDRFYFRRARLMVSGGFAEHFDFRLEADFGANSLGDGTGIRASANEIYVNWNRYPAANVRVGYLKPAFGGDQLWSDTTFDTIERPLGSDRIADGRQPGLGLYGRFPGQRAGYVVTVGHGNGSNSSRNDDDRFLGAARVYGTLLDSPTAGRLVGAVNVMHSEDSAVSKPGFGFDATAGGAVDGIFRGQRMGWGADAQWTLGRLQFGGEFLRERFEPDNALPVREFDAQGWQLTAAYMVVPRRLQAVLRREVFDPNLDAAGDATRNWVAGLNYLLKGDDIKLMVNYLFGDAPGLPGDSGRLLARVQLMY
ncbi:MAG: porin [Steroidobacteraceae bacterium]